MAYFNFVLNEILTKERQQEFLREAEERHLFHLATVQQVRPRSGLLVHIRNLTSNLRKRRETAPANVEIDSTI